MVSLTKTKGEKSIPTYVFRETDTLGGEVLYPQYQDIGNHSSA